MIGVTLIETAIGPCGLAWTTAGIRALQLPEATDAATRARLLRIVPDAQPADPPPDIGAAIARVRALLRGIRDDLADIALDLDGTSPFERAVYGVTRAIAPGSTLTYGAVAAGLGEAGAARAVGAALGRNPVAIIIPCHRVLAAGGADGGFSAAGGVETKRRLLAIEGAITPQPDLFATQARG
jgi:methylated-DNA-[protein]-cysteine S-methyltransferase